MIAEDNWAFDILENSISQGIKNRLLIFVGILSKRMIYNMIFVALNKAKP